MQLSLDKSDAHYQIQAYNHGCVTINGQKYFESILIMPDHLISPWGPTTLESLNESYFIELLKYEPELVLLGTGKNLQFPSSSLFLPLSSKHIGVEVMDTGAACRTYTLLVSEGRKVVAGLLM